jgi:hypothetical protein
MAGCTKGNQKRALMNARATMMNRKLTFRPAGAAATTVPVEHCVTLSGKSPARMRLAGVTPNA